MSAVSKAMDRLPSKKRSMREATLAWLESAARTREARVPAAQQPHRAAAHPEGCPGPCSASLLRPAKLLCDKDSHVCTALPAGCGLCGGALIWVLWMCS